MPSARSACSLSSPSSSDRPPTKLRIPTSCRTTRCSSGYDPSRAYPFGRLNPAAPPETEQFAFTIGEFDTVDQIRQQDGSWKTVRGIWNAKYFLNGCAIQDEYWSEDFATSNLRLYDASRGLWVVTYHQMPRYSFGVWEGKKEGDRMIMRSTRTQPDGTVVESRLTFSDITGDGYEWIGESVVNGSRDPVLEAVLQAAALSGHALALPHRFLGGSGTETRSPTSALVFGRALWRKCRPRNRATPIQTRLMGAAMAVAPVMPMAARLIHL